jgi:phage virion morphogenesis protein
MSDDFSALENWAGALLNKLSAGERRKVATTIARDLQRIKQQQNPDGTAYEQRKPRELRGKKGSVRREMFEKMRSAKYLKAKGDANSATVQFVGRVQRIAQVHQEGLYDKVDRKADKSPIAKYPKRQLLGFTDADRNRIQNLLIQHLT